MTKAIRKTMVLLLAAVMLIASCSNDIEKVTPSAILETGQTRGNARTMLPDQLPAPSFYDIRVIPVESESMETITYTNATADEKGNIELVGIPNGKYKIEVDGLDANKAKLYYGTSKEGELLVITNSDIAATMAIDLNPIFVPETTGSLSVTFDWQDLVPLKNTSRALSLDLSDESISERGPFTTALADPDGKLIFQLYLGDTPETLAKFNQEITWTQATGEPTGITCVFKNIPITKGQYAAFSILYEKNGDESTRIVLMDKAFLTVVQIYTNQTSYYDGDSSFVLQLRNRNTWFRNIYDLVYRYPTTETDTTLYLDWSDLRKNNKSLYENIVFTYGRMDRSGEVLTKTVYPARDDVSSVLLDGLLPDVEYYVQTQTKSTNGKVSDIKEWTVDGLTGFKTKKEVSEIKINGSVLPAMTIGDTFKISASILPANASYNHPVWTSTNNDVLIISEAKDNNSEVTVYANKPGVTKLKVSNGDPNTEAPNSSRTIDTDISVILDTPQELKAAIAATPAGKRGIILSWNPVVFAENYEVYRKVGTGDEAFEKVATLTAKELEYVDTDLLTGNNYSYKVIATATTYNTESFSANSKETAPTAPITMPMPKITLTPTKVGDVPFEISGANIAMIDGMPTIVVEGKDLTTLTIAEKPGTTYTWIFNNETIRNNNENTFSFDATSPFINNQHEKGIQELLIVAKTEGNDLLWSKTIQISMVTDPVVGIELNSKNLPSGSYIPTNEPDLAFVANVLPSAATNHTVIYRVETPEMEEIATISAKGKITVKKPGTVKFIATSEENPEATTSAVYTFFTPTFTSQKDLISKVNAELQKHIPAANNEFPDNDWFPPMSVQVSNTAQSTYNGTDTEGNGKIKIQTAIGGTISHTRESQGPGSITFTDYKLSDGTVINGKLIINTDYPGNYLGKENLKYLGIGEDKDNTLTLTLPNTQGEATIVYSTVNVMQKLDGTYKISFTNKLPLANGETVGGKVDIYQNADTTGIANPLLK